jgi:AbrB family looped-hinge helix DNA binding protein
MELKQILFTSTMLMSYVFSHGVVMASSAVRVSARNQVSIPKQVRNQLKLKAGDRLLLDVQDGLMVLVPLRGTFTQSLAGLNREIWENSRAFILRERNSWNDSTKL